MRVFVAIATLDHNINSINTRGRWVDLKRARCLTVTTTLHTWWMLEIIKRWAAIGRYSVSSCLVSLIKIKCLLDRRLSKVFVQNQ